MKTQYLLILARLTPIFIIGVNEAHAQYGCPPISGRWHPKISIDQNNVYVFWNYFVGCGTRVLLFEKSNDNGVMFESPVTLEGPPRSGSYPAVAASNGNHIYVVGPEYAFKDGNHMVVSQSSNDGISFSNSTDFDQNSMSTVPEFPFEFPILLASFVSIMVFYRIRIRK